MTRNVIFMYVIILNILSYALSEEEIDLDTKEISIDLEAFSQLPGIKVNSKLEVDDITAKSDITYLMFFYSKSSKNSYVSVQFIQAIYNKLEYLAGVILVDCDETKEFEFCLEKHEGDSFPRLRILSPPQFKINPYTKKEDKYQEIQYTKGTISENDIYSFVTSNIKSKGIKVNQESYKSIIKHPNFNKVLLFTDKQQTGLIFKGLSSYFYDRILFLEVHNSEAELIHKYKIKKFPSLIVVESLESDLETERENVEIHEYTGNLKTKAIAEFISKFTHKEKLYLNKKGTSTDEYNKDKMIQSFFKKLGGESLVESFERLKDKRVMLLLAEDDEITEGLVLFAKKTNGFFSFIKVNCSEKESNLFCSKFKVSQYPSLLLLNEKGLHWISRASNSIEIKGDSFEEIVNEVKNEFSSNITGLNKDNFNAFTFKTLTEDNKRPIIYLFDKGDMDISIHLMSTDAELLKSVTFYGYSNPEASLTNQLGVQALPNLVILGKDALNPEK